MIDFRRMDCFTRLGSMDSSSVDLIVTDPPYQSTEKFRTPSPVQRLTRWFDVIENEKLPTLLLEFYRVLKQDSHAYIFCSFSTLNELLRMNKFLERVGTRSRGPMLDDFQRGLFTVWKPLVWYKQNTGMGYHYRASYEFILFFEKGKRSLNSNSIRDVLSYGMTRSSTKYPTEKPAELLQVLIEQSSNPGDLVLDPFVGSGATIEACLRTRRSFIGGDISESSESYIRARGLL